MRAFSLLLTVICACVLHQCFAAYGDQRADHRMLVRACEKRCDSQPTTAVNSYGEPLPFHLRLFLWDCKSNCKYESTQQTNQLMIDSGEEVAQFYGKWPFVRVWGMQELFSTLFSIGNALPHAYFFFYRRQDYAPEGSYMRPLVLAFSVAGMNTWLWSTAFHARELWWTERLDYHFATSLIMTSLVVTICRTFQLKRGHHQAMVAALVGGTWLAHVLYMNLVHFDYGWNMVVTAGAGALDLATWAVFVIRYRHLRYRWKIATYLALLYTFGALFEVLFDFPPYFGLLDAHAIWHGSTIGLGYLWYSFTCDDAKTLCAEAGVVLPVSQKHKRASLVD